MTTIVLFPIIAFAKQFENKERKIIEILMPKRIANKKYSAEFKQTVVGSSFGCLILSCLAFEVSSKAGGVFYRSFLFGIKIFLHNNIAVKKCYNDRVVIFTHMNTNDSITVCWW